MKNVTGIFNEQISSLGPKLSVNEPITCVRTSNSLRRALRDLVMRVLAFSRLKILGTSV